MYSVLIAEDEILVRMGLTVSVPWEKMDMYVVQDVSNGREALEAWQKYKPDILITDLAMPGMDGLSLIRKIREEDEDTAIVVVTCMEDFDMLHTAMSLGVCAYLVKVSMTIEDITQALTKARDSLGEARNHSAVQMTENKKMELLCEYLLHKTMPLKTFVETARKHAWALPSGMAMAYVNIQDAEGLSEVARRMLSHMCQEYLQCFHPVCFSYGGDASLEICAVLEAEAEATAVRRELTRYIKYIQTHFSVTARAVVSEKRLKIGRMGVWLEKAAALARRDYLFLDQESICADENGSVWADGIEKVVRQLNMQLLYLDRHSVAAMNALQHVVRAVGQDEERVQRHMHLLSEYVNMQSAPWVHAGVVSALESISRSLPPAPSVRKEVEEAQDYLETHLHEKLRLSQVASFIHVNPQYLSSIFKQELRIGYSDYINLLRVREAARLLEEGDVSFQEIAEKCGFSDVAYFCRVFKQRTGVTPSQWRRGER